MTTLLVDTGTELEIALGARVLGTTKRTADFRTPPESLPPEVETIVINAEADVRSATDLCTRLRLANPRWTVVLWGGRAQAEAFRRHSLVSFGAADAYVMKEDGERAVRTALGARAALPSVFDWSAALGLFACLSMGLIMAVFGRNQEGAIWLSATVVLYALLMMSPRHPIGQFGRRLRATFWIAVPVTVLIAFVAKLLD